MPLNKPKNMIYGAPKQPTKMKVFIVLSYRDDVCKLESIHTTLLGAHRARKRLSYTGSIEGTFSTHIIEKSVNGTSVRSAVKVSNSYRQFILSYLGDK